MHFRRFSIIYHKNYNIVWDHRQHPPISQHEISFVPLRTIKHTTQFEFHWSCAAILVVMPCVAGQTKRQTRIGRPRGNGRPHSQGCHRSYAPCLQALLLFARAIVNIGDFYYCIVLTIRNVISNGITCIYKIIELN